MNFFDVLKLLVVLGMTLVAIIYVIKFGLVRMQPDYYRQKGALKVVERLTLGPKSGLVLVQAGERYLLLGVSSESIHVLTEISPEEIHLPEPSTDAPDFRAVLETFMAKTAQAGSMKERVGTLISEKINGRRAGKVEKQK